MTTSPLWNALAIEGTRKAARSAATVMMCLMVTPSLGTIIRKSGATDRDGASDAELVGLLAEAGDVAQLDVLVPADDVGQPRQAHRPFVARRREVAHRAVDQGAVLARQRALH